MTSILGPRDRAIARWEYPLDLLDPRPLTEPEARGVIQFVWDQRGLKHPPKLEMNDRISGAFANRFKVTLGNLRNTVTLLHELAHCMDQSVEVASGFYSDRPEGESITGSSHDDNWLGIYVDLLNDFMGPKFNKLYLMKTLRDAGLTFSMCPVIRCR